MVRSKGGSRAPLIPVLVGFCAARSLAGDVPLGHPDFHPSPEHPVGFRGDWTGRYPGATPILEFGVDYNVLWKTYVGHGECSPIVVGEKVFAVGDGIRLVCVDKRTGRELWRRERHAKADDPAEAKGRALEDAVALYHLARIPRGQASLLDERVKSMRRRNEQYGEPLDTNLVTDLEKQRDTFRAEQAKHEAELSKVDKSLHEGVKSLQPLMHQIPTPCSDGKRVYVCFSLGAVACYDLDGNRLWYRLLGDNRCAGGWYNSHVAPSPALADNKLVVRYDKLYCLDVMTGKTLWAVEADPGLKIPSPVIGKWKGRFYVGYSSQIFDLADGRKLLADTHVEDVGSPIYYDGIFCWVSHAVKLPDTPEGKPTLLWEQDPKALYAMTCDDTVSRGGVRGMGWHGYASPVWNSGLVHYNADWSVYSAFDGATGKLRFLTPVPINKEIYPSMTLAGDCLFLPDKEGRYMVLSQGIDADYNVKAMGRTRVLSGRMPVFDGNRIFLLSAGMADKDYSEGLLCCIGDPLAAPAKDPFSQANEKDVAKLLKTMDDPDDMVVWGAVRALGKAPGGESVVPELVKRLSDKDERRKRFALVALRALGPKATVAIPALLPFIGKDAGIESTDREWNLLAGDALMAMGPAAIETVVAEAAKLQGDTRRPTMAGLPGFIKRCGPSARTAVPALMAIPEMQRDFLGMAAVLAVVDPEYLVEQGGVEKLADIAKGGSDANSRISAMEALGMLGPRAAAALAVVGPLANGVQRDGRGRDYVGAAAKIAAAKIGRGSEAKRAGK